MYLPLEADFSAARGPPPAIDTSTYAASDGRIPVDGWLPIDPAMGGAEEAFFARVLAAFFKRMAAAIWWRRMHWH